MRAQDFRAYTGQRPPRVSASEAVRDVTLIDTSTGDDWLGVSF